MASDLPGIPTEHFVGDFKTATAPLKKFLVVSRLDDPAA